MPTLPEVQACFLRALLNGNSDPALPLISARTGYPAERLAIYANNAAANFEGSLRLCFPAVLRLVGDVYFSWCVSRYRRRYPSRSGDLQHAGASFASFMGGLHRRGEYRYLEDIARLEWLYQEALTAADHEPLDLSRLAGVPADRCIELCFSLHPAARLFTSDIPALQIWEANVGDAESTVVDLTSGGDRVLLARTRGRLEFHRLGPGEHRFLEALRSCADFRSALDGALEIDPSFDGAAALQRFVLIHAIVDF